MKISGKDPFMTGSLVRAGRLFDRKSGNAFVAAMDHGLVTGVRPGNERVLDTAKRLISCEPQGVLLSLGALERTAHLFSFHGAPSIIVRTDFLIVEERVKGLGEHYRVLCHPEAAAARGVDAIAMFLAVGAGGELISHNARAISESVVRAHSVGMGVMVEVVTWGSRSQRGRRDPEELLWGCRMAAELGADLIKTEYPGTRKSMRRIVEGCHPVPVLVLGGPKVGSEEALLGTTLDCMESGARGVVYGRNLWQAEDAQSISVKLRNIIHREYTATGASAHIPGNG
ncbi:class I fructose-bisphosphate aldolase [Rubrobacter calidifluminis]|uniref:class I fructose-bisphosphate aldolase n=1 Tax=Rubrobacter calidifluminis TaxID=1392640 RepID=UPI00235F8DF0|nr:hypothetical protein [Rubrobacter calidifluminis]